MSTKDNIQAPGAGNKAPSKPAHELSAAAVIEELQANKDEGLTVAQAKELLTTYGTNELGDGAGVQPAKILLRQIANAMTLVLVMAMAVSFGIGSYIEGGVITAVIVLNIVVGFWQEFNAAKTMDSLKSLSSPTASALRGSENVTVPTIEVVPGDIIELTTGDTVPADLRLFECVNFETDEALLTGESLPVHKEPLLELDEDTGPGDRLNVAYSSSTVTKGRARGVVFATGLSTEIGSIAAALRATGSKVRTVKRNDDGKAGPHRYAQAWSLTATDAVGRFLGVNVGTPLQKKLSRLAILLFWIAVVCAIIVLAANSFSNEREVIIYAVATGLSMIPASLIVVLTITMAAGTKRMVERHVIVRNLKSLEALGAVTDICSDKTGTLTQGKMIAKRAYVPACGVFSVEDAENPSDPTEGRVTLKDSAGQDASKARAFDVSTVQDNTHLKSFLDVAALANCRLFGWQRSGLTESRGGPWKTLVEYPFDSDVKKMSVVMSNSQTKEVQVFTKGAVERVLESCASFYPSADSQESTPMTEQQRLKMLDTVDEFASQGLRVLALASRAAPAELDFQTDIKRDLVECDLTLRGLIGLYDPPRAESAASVAGCRNAGIEVHMLTGDHPGTARAIAIEVGILPSRTELQKLPKDVSNSLVMTASSFDKLSDDEVDRLPQLPLVVARCAPHTKVRMIEALHRRRKFAAMTGDGVNDSPSLKMACVGIAMGLAGSDVAKDACDIVLTDDNFASILNAIEEGRRMFDNIQKFILHLLAENIAQACTLLVGLAFKDARRLSVFPLAPVEIIWVIMITSGMPDMGLGFEQATPGIMDRAPQSLKRGVFTTEVLVDMLVYGPWIAALCLGAFSLVLFGFGDGQIGIGCNETYSPECDTVFRARATCFACLTWFALFLAWELVDMRRSFFRMQPDSKKYFTQWFHDVRRNKFLFWAILFGFVTIFPTLYIPVLNRVVFKHEAITWEWAIVIIATLLFFLGVECWKFMKRAYFRRQTAKYGDARRAEMGAAASEGSDTEKGSASSKGRVNSRE
nr:hypothetical protein B0A51_09594 [Rachicladosporium sp. CCFEE 5018]